MDIPNALNIVTGKETQHVDVRAIEQELTKLWKAAGDQAKSREGQVVMRACVMNLIVYTRPEDMSQVDQTIQDVTLRHPGRVIIITAEPDAKKPSLDAWISAHSHLPSAGGPQIFSEQITIAAAGSAVEGVGGTVVPLLVTNIPTTLWWTGDVRFVGSIFDELIEVSDEVVVDSSIWSQVHSDLPRLAYVAEHGTSVGDLNWARLTSWRSLVAQFFDAADKRPLLRTIQKVEISYAGNVAQALLLAGWIASSLAWHYTGGKITADQGGELGFKSGSGNVSLEFQVIDAIATKSGIQKVSIGMDVNGEVATFSVCRRDDDHAITTVAMPGLKTVESTSRFGADTDAALLASELDLQAEDTTLSRARSQVVEWLKIKERGAA